jgi:hypothetical protein
MYDVIYIDRVRRSNVLGSGLERASAVSTARSEARRRRVGRMFLAGSEPMDRSQMIVIVKSEPSSA